MRSTFVRASFASLFGLTCLTGSVGANNHPNVQSSRSDACLADPASFVSYLAPAGTSVIDGPQSWGQLEDVGLTCGGDAVDTDGDGILDASSSERRMGELDCSDPRLVGCKECLGTVRVCCPSQECTVSNCPGDSKYCPNDKGGGSHCC